MAKLTATQQKLAATAFLKNWQRRGDEKSDTQTFWCMLLRDVFGAEQPEQILAFEKRVRIGKTTKFIDAFIEHIHTPTHILIEQKSVDVDLSIPERQSDGQMLTPFEQAKRYDNYLPHDKHARYIICCNFAEFYIYDMNQERPELSPLILSLNDLPRSYSKLDFLVDEQDTRLFVEKELSIQAGRLVGKLYDALAKQYHDMQNPRSQRSLNVLCVRLVFCLYAEDAEIFGKRALFYNYFREIPPEKFRPELIRFFHVLDTPEDKRDAYLEPKLAAFPYVNGGMFAEEIEIPQFTDEIIGILLDEASAGFRWENISPTIFGAVFESTLNPMTRRSGGMHYTSIENIHKVIDPLFLDDLHARFEAIHQQRSGRAKTHALKNFRRSLQQVYISTLQQVLVIFSRKRIYLCDGLKTKFCGHTANKFFSACLKIPCRSVFGNSMVSRLMILL